MASSQAHCAFITHSVEEAVGLADRIFVMSPSPGEVAEEIKVDLARPRPIAPRRRPGIRCLCGQDSQAFRTHGCASRS